MNKTNYSSRCIRCAAALDIEDKIFNNLCQYCGTTQGYNLVDEQW